MDRGQNTNSHCQPCRDKGHLHTTTCTSDRCRTHQPHHQHGQRLALRLVAPYSRRLCLVGLGQGTKYHQSLPAMQGQGAPPHHHVHIRSLPFPPTAPPAWPATSAATRGTVQSTSVSRRAWTGGKMPPVTSQPGRDKGQSRYLPRLQRRHCHRLFSICDIRQRSQRKTYA